MSRKQLSVGDLVVLKVDKVPYYSGYGGNPEVLVKAGTVGRVGAVDVPQVCRPKNAEHDEPTTFHCVDFVLAEFNGAPTHGNHTWRVSAYANEIVTADPSLASLAEHAEAWWAKKGNPVPNRDHPVWQNMYERWLAFAFDTAPT